MTPLARLVRARRKALGLSQAQLADRLHCARVTVTYVESAVHMIKLDRAQRWCDVLGVSPERLMRAASRSVCAP